MGKNVMVVGGGTMGQGIALAAALAGHATTIVDLPEALPRIDAAIDRFLADRVKKGKLSGDGAREVRGAIRVEEGLEAARSADWIIEAIVEVLEPKKKLFADLEQRIRPGAMLCTNTSSLSVTAMAAGLRRPAAVLGLHFFNPATVMPLVEIVRTCWTEPATVESAVAFVKGLGKTPVLVKDTPGFVVNRVARPFPVEALRIVTEGTATPAQVDRIMKLGAGVGEDRYRPCPLLRKLVAAGFTGKRAGRGFFEYGEAPAGAQRAR
jgi:3-hydroxybutyryl-CoA dehydrogenase